MSDFDNVKCIKRRHDWLNGFDTEDVSKPNYQLMLMSDDAEISAAADKYMKIYREAEVDFIKNGALETPSFSYGEENAPFTSFLYIF